MPDLPVSLKLQLVDKIKEMYQLEGWVSTDYVMELAKIGKIMFEGRNGEEKLMQMMEVGSYRG